MTVPSGIGLLDAHPYVITESQASSERAGSRAVFGHLLHHVPTPAGHHRRSLAGAVERGGAVPSPPQHEHHGRKPGEVDLDGERPEVDVITEQHRRLVPIDRATDVGQDADVVQSGEVLRVQSQPSTQTHADPRRASHVLGWLPEPEVGGHGERHQQV